MKETNRLSDDAIVTDSIVRREAVSDGSDLNWRQVYPFSNRIVLQKKDYLILTFFFIVAFLATYLVKNNFFIWDTIQVASAPAQWFYDNNFTRLFFPENLDTGHPPAFPAYLAAVWKIFGQSLPVSHFAMLPFLIGIVFQLYLLTRKFFKESFFIYGFLILLVEPTILSQAILVSPDVLLLFSFLLSFNSLLNGRRFLLSVSLVILAMTSMRGMMHVAALFSVEVILYFVYNRNLYVKNLINIALPYLPAGLAGGGWLLLHYLHTGWIGYHANSPAADAFQVVDFWGFLRNILIFGWRLVDFGKIFIWLWAIPIFYFSVKSKRFNKNAQVLLLSLIMLVVFIAPNLVIYKAVLGHRYLMVIYLMASLFVLYQTQELFSRYFKPVMLMLFAGLASGNLWVYPDRLAVGWDSTLAHYPYYEQRRRMLQFINNERLDVSYIGTAFPNNRTVKEIDLSSEGWNFPGRNLDKNEYVYYSNLFNDFSDEELERLKSWEKVKEFHSYTVKTILYKKPEE